MFWELTVIGFLLIVFSMMISVRDASEHDFRALVFVSGFALLFVGVPATLWTHDLPDLGTPPEPEPVRVYVEISTIPPTLACAWTNNSTTAVQVCQVPGAVPLDAGGA